MAKIDFYILGRSDANARFEFACRLTEKAWRLRNRIHIETASRSDAERLDELLWTFRDGSFVPHEIAADNDDIPIVIGFHSASAGERDLLISLCDEVPAIAEGFPRVAELVTSDDTARAAGRKRFSHYRERGHEIDTHDI